MNETVLISGASIAGPSLAYWLNRCGFRPTVVEKASTVRPGGYPIDLRGIAVEVIDRMGLLSQARGADIATSCLLNKWFFRASLSRHYDKTKKRCCSILVAAPPS